MLSDLIIYTPMYITFFWAILLLSTAHQENRAKYFLGVFMFVAFMLYVSHAIFFNNRYEIYVYFDPVYTFASLSVYPLYYWYIKLLTVETSFQIKNFIMLLPAFLLATATVVVYIIMSAEERQDYVVGVLFKNQKVDVSETIIKVQKAIYYTGRLVFSIQVIFFLVKGSRLVMRYNKNICNFYSNLESKTIGWVNLLLYSFVLTSIMSIVFNVLGKTVFIESTFHLLIPSLIFSLLLFMIGYQGYMQNYTVADLELDKGPVLEIEIKKINQQKLKESLKELFTNQKMYKQVDLKITHVSEMLNTNRTYISTIINKEFACSFSEFVNRYRVLEAKKLLQEESSKNYSLDHISEKAGFGSLHTFIRVFKESEGITPGRYRDQYYSSAQNLQ